MGNIITGWEFGALLAMVALLFGFLEMMNVRERINRLRDVRQKERGQAEEDERERRRMVHEADSKPSKEEIIAFADQQAEFCGDMLALIDQHKPANMEPFCGEGKKKRERKQESRATELESPSPLFLGAGRDPEPSRPASHSSYSSHGGSFDGGGSSGDWSSSSSSSSSDSGSCSSSSSDSGSSSCSSSD